MLQFIKNYIYYMQIEVLEPNFHKFKLALKQVKTFDDIINLHSNYLDQCLKECLLTDQSLFKTITQINMRTHWFSRVVIRFFINVEAEGQVDFKRDLNQEEEKEFEIETNQCQSRKASKQKETELIRKNIKDNDYAGTVNKFEKDFDKHMRDLLVQLTKTKRFESHIANLCQRLDYNDYYSINVLKDVQIMEH